MAQLLGPLGREEARSTASRLIAHYGTLPDALRGEAATYRRLLGDQRAWRLLRLTVRTIDHYHSADLHRGPLFDTWPKVIAYLHTMLAVERVEQFRCLLLDTRNRLIRDDLLFTGSIDWCQVDVRSVLVRALEARAAAIILVHNHPSGDPTPSIADRAITRRIIQAAQHLDIGVHDHVIIGRAGHISFRAEGLI